MGFVYILEIFSARSTPDTTIKYWEYSDIPWWLGQGRSSGDQVGHVRAKQAQPGQPMTTYTTGTTSYPRYASQHEYNGGTRTSTFTGWKRGNNEIKQEFKITPKKKSGRVTLPPPPPSVNVNTCQRQQQVSSYAPRSKTLNRVQQSYTIKKIVATREKPTLHYIFSSTGCLRGFCWSLVSAINWYDKRRMQPLNALQYFFSMSVGGTKKTARTFTCQKLYIYTAPQGTTKKGKKKTKRPRVTTAGETLADTN